MIYQSQDMRLSTVHTTTRNERIEIQVCENLNDDARGLYTVLVIKDHELLKRFIRLNEGAEEVQEPMLLDCFANAGEYVVVYPYKKERRLSLFYQGRALKLAQAEEICINLIIACMTSNLPWQLLYLVMTQGLIHLARDGSVYLSYTMDLTEMDEGITEKDCVVECAKLLLEMLTPLAESRRRSTNSYVLLRKKIEKRAYTTFRELYKDLELAAVQERKHGAAARIRLWFERNRDTLFRIILVISIVLAVFVVLTFLTNLIFGDVPWLRIFIRSFERIGLESLLQ